MNFLKQLTEISKISILFVFRDRNGLFYAHISLNNELISYTVPLQILMHCKRNPQRLFGHPGCKYSYPLFYLILYTCFVRKGIKEFASILLLSHVQIYNLYGFFLFIKNFVINISTSITRLFALLCATCKRYWLYIFF